MNFSLRDAATNAIRYWEPRRFLYNAVLSIIVISYFITGLPKSAKLLTFDGFLGLFLLAVIANILYCAAYIVDIFIQLSDFRETWLRYRWTLLLIGILFASIVTRFFSVGIFFSHD